VDNEVALLSKPTLGGTRGVEWLGFVFVSERTIKRHPSMRGMRAGWDVYSWTLIKITSFVRIRGAHRALFVLAQTTV
jgi:hypothetical protein